MEGQTMKLAIALLHKKLHGHRNALTASLQDEHEMLAQNGMNQPHSLWRLPRWRISLSGPWVISLALALTVSTGILNYVMGRDVAMSALYLAPICWASWVAGRRAGLLLAVICTVSWFMADLKSGYVYLHPLIPFWNALMLLAFFLVVVYLLSAFQAAHHHLEETVQKRTAALQAEIVERKRLEIAKVQSERLAVVGTMAAEVAHEVRNPLSSIILNLDLTYKEIDRFAEKCEHSPEEGHLLVDEMRAEVRRIQNVIEDYLRFARLPKPQRRPMELNKLLDQKLAFLNGEFEQAGVKPRINFDPALMTLNADAEQLWQATLNLIRNGLDAMPGGGELTVSTWQEGGHVRLRVTDTGRGMTKEQVEQVFVPFFTTKPEGTGLGLTLVQQIATEHGGHVECESVPGKGSSLTIFLPVHKNPDMHFSGIARPKPTI
jgi:signal transduction histidine kinase